MAGEASWRRVRHRFRGDAQDESAGVLGWRYSLGDSEGSVRPGWLVSRSHGAHVDRRRLGKLFGNHDARAIRSSLFQSADWARRDCRCPNVRQSGIQESRVRFRYRFLVSVRLCKLRKTFLQSLGREATFKEISKRIVESVELPLPPMQKQRRFRETLESLIPIDRRRIQSARRVADLLDVLLGRAFSGDLTASWRGRPIEELVRETRRPERTLTDAGP